MRKNFTEQEEFDRYIEIGAYMKILCEVAVSAETKISNSFNKTNHLSKKIEKIRKELEQLRSDLEDSMPYDETTRLCNEKQISPLDIFYGYTNLNKVNKQQMQLIYDRFMKKTLENELNDLGLPFKSK